MTALRQLARVFGTRVAILARTHLRGRVPAGTTLEYSCLHSN
jgi:hypothetical protein